MPEISQYIEYGAMGLCFFLSFILYKQRISHDKMMANHETHFIEICEKNTEATKENTLVLQSLKDVILSLKK